MSPCVLARALGYCPIQRENGALHQIAKRVQYLLLFSKNPGYSVVASRYIWKTVIGLGYLVDN